MRSSRRRAAILGALTLLAAACIGDNPVEPDARAAIFNLLGGLEVGEALSLQGRQAERIDLPAGLDGAEFVLVAFLGSDQNTSVAIRLDRAERFDAVGPLSVAGLGPGGLGLLGRRALLAEPPTARLHERLRREEIERLEPRLQAMSRPGIDLRTRGASAPAAPVPVVGDVLSLRVFNDASADLCENHMTRSGRVAAVSASAIVVIDEASPAELGAADIATIVSELGSVLLPVNVEHFGEPTDVDGNDRVILFFTPAANDLPAAGFFFAGDLLSRSECAASNEAEIVYVMSPDPAGQTALQADVNEVAFFASGIIAHELQHLISAGRRIHVNNAPTFETVWLNEGLSHIAEELVFYALTPFGPGENIELGEINVYAETADRFVVSNLFAYAQYAAAPWQASLSGLDNGATRGGMWAFLRYVADHEGRPDSELFFELANSTRRGLGNLNAVLRSGDALNLMQAWTASVFSDDHLEGVPAFLTQPSWDFRSVLPALTNAFPLSTFVVPTNPVQFDLSAGGAVFLRVTVGAAVPTEVRFDVTGSAAGSFRVSVIRVR